LSDNSYPPDGELNLKIAVLGDSVPWGQGLLDEHKYAYQIKHKLQASDLFLKAHSGAVICDSNRTRQAVATSEVPIATPTILDQVDQVDNPSLIDLVLLNGGINDVNIRTILNPATTSAYLHEVTLDVC